MMILAGVILLGAVLLGVIRSTEMARVPDAIVMVSMTEPGCDTAGQLWLNLTNFSDRPILRVFGTLSYGTQTADRVPMGNFELEGRLLPNLSRGTCIAVDESRRPQGDRRDGWWLAWVTKTEFDEKTGNPSNPVDQGFLQGASR